LNNPNAEGFGAVEGVKLMEAFMYRLHPSWVAVRELVASRRLGQLCAVQSWFSYFNDDPTNIRNIAESGRGGALRHRLLQRERVTDDLRERPVSVQASVERDPVMGVDVMTSAILEFDEGVATFTCSTRAEPDQRVHVYGTEGRISVGIPFNIPPELPTEVLVTAGGMPPVSPNTEVLTFDPADQYAVQAERFARAVLDDEAVPIAPEESVANMRVIDRIVELGA
jgi:predicted dehydrogenase